MYWAKLFPLSLCGNISGLLKYVNIIYVYICDMTRLQLFENDTVLSSLVRCQYNNTGIYLKGERFLLWIWIIFLRGMKTEDAFLNSFQYPTH